MTKAEQFEALALRCEQATGMDRELDAAIYIVAVRGESPSDFRINPQFADYIPKYTDSLDAALTLVPEGMRPSVGQNVHHGYWHAFVQSIVDSTPHQLGGAVSNTSGALALCTAALRARAQMERGK